MPGATIRQSKKVEYTCNRCGTRFLRYESTARRVFCSVKCRCLGSRPPYRTRPVEERFWEKVDRRGTDECWPWLAVKDADGYGHFSAKRGHPSPASRFSFQLANGNIDQSLLVLHKCDNPSCVNPNHLFQGTQLDNVRDCVNKGRRVPPWAGRTHCIHGHEFNEENTYLLKYNGRIRRKCRACHRIKNRMYRRGEHIKSHRFKPTVSDLRTL